MIGPGSETTLDEFVYSGPTELPSAQKMQVSLTRGVFRFTTGTLDKKAYLISTQVASIAVQGTVLDIDVGSGLTRVTLVEGRALVCPRRPGVTFEQQRRACAKAPGGRQAPGCDCVELNDPGQTAEVTTAGGSNSREPLFDPRRFRPALRERLALRGPALRFGCSRRLAFREERYAATRFVRAMGGRRSQTSHGSLSFARWAASAPAQELDLEGSDTTRHLAVGRRHSHEQRSGLHATLTNEGPSSTFSGVIVDGGPTATTGLTQDSTVSGTLTLTGANTYSGPTTVQAGTLMGGARTRSAQRARRRSTPAARSTLGGSIRPSVR